MNRLNLLLILFFTVQLYAQESNTYIQGKVLSGSTPIENIHIINRSTNKGTISNKKGNFKIYVRVNDTITFSGVQFYTKTMIISKIEIHQKFLNILLYDKINELEEVNLEYKDLSGNLLVDSKKVMDSISKIQSGALNFAIMDFSLTSISVAKQLDEDRLPDSTDPMMPLGGDILGLLSFVLKPAIKEVSKIGKKKRQQKAEEKRYQNALELLPEKIRKDLGDNFFEQTLKISTDQIDDFILYCVKNGAGELFLKNKKMEMIDVFLTESKIYNK